MSAHSLRRARAAQLLATAGLAVTAMAAIAPAPLAAQKAPSIPHEKYTLPNGLEVILHVDRSVPIVAVENFYKVGSGDEKPGRTGFAHLFEHVMFMGSQNVPVGKFDEWLEAAGASNNGSTNFDRTNYYETGPSNALPLMLWLDADRMGWLLPTMDQSKLDLQRDVVKNERRQGVDNAPYGKADETILPVLFPKGHPYSWDVIGSMDDLSDAALDDVKDFFRLYYAPDNATITIAGDFEPDSAKAWITKYFGRIPRNATPITRPTAPAITLTRDTVLVLEDRVQLPRVYYTWHGVKAFSADDAALDAVAQRIQLSRAKLDNPNKPIGVFMLAGPSGVGKTETALTLAEALYGGEQNMITINMSEFQEAHTVSTLKGAPPGYVGYGEGGVLTEAVRRKPYSVVLLDEVEKAHSDVHEIFFQVFDKGIMEDGEGRLIDFKNTLIILTTNVGTDLIMNMCKDPELLPDPEGIAKALRAPLLKTFPAALLGRIVTIPYYPLSDAMLDRIVRLQMNRVVRRVREAQGIEMSYGDDVVELVVSRCTEPESGGRMIDAILTNTLLPKVSFEVLTRLAAGETVRRIEVSAADGDFAYALQ